MKADDSKPTQTHNCFALKKRETKSTSSASFQPRVSEKYVASAFISLDLKLLTRPCISCLKVIFLAYCLLFLNLVKYLPCSYSFLENSFFYTSFVLKVSSFFSRARAILFLQAM